MDTWTKAGVEVHARVSESCRRLAFPLGDPVPAVSTEPKVLALFDFDGTLTRADTMFAFLRFVVGDVRFALGMAWMGPLLVLQRLGVVPAATAKERLLLHFLAGMSREVLDGHARKFHEQVVPGILRPDGLARLSALQSAGAEMALVTASLDLWTAPFAAAKGMTLLATPARWDAAGNFAGLGGTNCNGPEKAIRIQAQFNLPSYAQIEAYGDTSGDREMLALAHSTFYRPFRGR